jgi:3-dehydroquinate synthase
MLERLTVGLGERSYPIWVGDGILERLGEALRAGDFPRQVAVITHPPGHGLHGERGLKALARGGVAASLVGIPDGAEYKSLPTLAQR